MDIQAPTLALISTGMITSVGGSSAVCAAAVNAGIAGYKESGYFNKRNRPIRIASIPEGALEPLEESLKPHVNQLPSSHSYLLRIASQALQECVSVCSTQKPIPIFMACPEVIAGTPPRIHSGFLKHLQVQSKVNIDIQSSRLSFTGRAGGFEMIEFAFKYFEATGSDYALIGGVDSYKYCLYQLGFLDSEDRLLVEGSGDGFIPGDGGGFLLLASAAAVAKHGLTPILKIAYPASAQEPGHRYSEEPYCGAGLAAAFAMALKDVADGQVDSIYTSLNGESFGNKELGVALTRSRAKIEADAKILHPADCFGDIGAAFGPVLLGLMSRARKCQGLAYCSADGPFRSALFAWK